MSKRHRRYYNNIREEGERYLPTGESYQISSLKDLPLKTKWDFKSIVIVYFFLRYIFS